MGNFRMDELALRRRILELEARVAELEPQAALHRVLTRARHDLLVELDADGRICWASQALLELLGITAGQCIGRSSFDFTSAETRSKLQAESPTLFDWAARRLPFEVPLPRKVGDTLWLEGNIYAHSDSNSSGFFCLYRDITEAKLLQNEHHRVTEGLAVALTLSGVETFEFDLDDGVVWQSPGYAALFGQTPSGAGVSHWSGIDDWLQSAHPEDRAQLRSLVEAASKPHEKRLPVVVRVPRSDGTQRYVECAVHCAFRTDGSVRRIIGVLRDVSADEECRSGLARTSERLNLVLCAGGCETFEFDVKTRDFHCSPGYGPLHGLPEGEHFGDFSSYLARVAPQHQQALRERYAHCDSTLGPVVYLFTGPDGQTRWLESVAYYQLDANGELERVLGANRDVTARESERDAHQKLSRRLALALRAGQIETFEWDGSGACVGVSDGCKALFGLAPEQAFYGPVEFAKHLAPADVERVLARDESARRAGAAAPVAPVRYPFACSDGRTLWIESSAIFEFDAQGQPQRRIGTLRDVTHEQQARTHLERLMRGAQLAVDMGEVGVAEWEAGSGWTEVSARYRELLGLQRYESPPELQAYMERVHADERELLLKHVEQGFETGSSPLATYRYQRSDGSTVWVESAASYERDAAGKLRHVMVISRDLTTQKAVEESLRASLERLSAAMHVGRVEVYERDIRTDEFSYSEGFLELLGWPKALPFSSEELESLVVPEDRLKLIERRHRPDMHGIPMQPVRFRLSSSSGIRWLESTSAYFYHQGEAVRSTGAMRDITAQVQAEEATRAQTAFFEALVENSPDIIVRIDGSGRFVLVNSAIESLLGIPVDKVLGRTPEDLPISAERAAEFRLRIENCFTTRDGDEFEIRFAKLPQAPWLLVRYVPEFGPGGEMRYILAVLRDVTMLKLIEQEALATARQLGQILETAEEGVLVVDADNVIIFTNPKIEQIFGYGANELLGKHESIFQNDPDDTRWQERATDRIAGLSESYTYRFQRKDGSPVMCWVNAKPLFDELGHFTSTLAMLTDVSDLERSEGVMRQTIEWLEFAMESAQIAGLDITLDASMASVSSRATVLFREWFGIQDGELEFPLTDWLRRVHAEDRERVEAQVTGIFARGASGRADFRVVDAHGDLHWLYAVLVTVRNLDGEIARVVITVVDISERKQLEQERETLQAQIARGQREESMETLAGGLAHDLNNLLTTAFGHVDIAKHGASAEADSSLSLVEETLTEMTRLAQRMLAYAGKTPINPSTLDLNACLIEVHGVMQVLVSKNAHFQARLQPGKLPVHSEESQLQQIATELLMNASEALRGREGAITLETGSVLTETLEPAVQARLTGAKSVAFLRVIDTGEGLTATAQARIFEPFYSSRAAGRGLGLAVVDGLVRGHHGAIEVQSEPGSGSTFTVYLPLQREQALPQSSAPVSVASSSQRGSGLILIVDDETTLRNLVSRTLTMQGFQTLLATNGDEALEVLAREPQVDLVLLDLTMPQRDGLEVYREMLRSYRHLRVVLMSGYSEQSVASRLEPGAPIPLFLQKPFRAGELLSIVQRALAGA